MKIKIKKWDIIIICLLFVLSFLPYGMAKIFLGKNASQVYACINVDGKIYKEVPLTGQKDRKELMIKTSAGYNKLVIENESIAVEDTDCSDHVCEYFGHIKEPGDIIVCLPHKIYIEVKGTAIDSSDEGLDARGY